MRSDPFTGRYLFHLHTTYTDGQLSVEQYFDLAQRERVERLIFLEHIRAQASYDVERFVAEVTECAAAFNLPALVGFEAKLLPGGALDIAPEHAALAAVIGIAEHGFPGDYDLWHASLREALRSSSAYYPSKAIVWVHPGLWLKKKGLLAEREGEYCALLDTAHALGIRVERNLRYGLVPERLPGAPPVVIGADAHRLGDLEGALALLPP